MKRFCALHAEPSETLAIYIYIYIYILDSHMAPYGACEVEQSSARTNAQFEAERFRLGFRSKNKHGRKWFRRKTKHARKYFRREVMHSSKQSDFERDLQVKTSKVESAFEGKRSIPESAFEGKRSMFEQCFRALSGLEARSSSDFERSVASKEKGACSSTNFERSVAFRRSKKQARAVIWSSQRAKSKLEQ